jgi:hypothetical protein
MALLVRKNLATPGVLLKVLVKTKMRVPDDIVSTQYFHIKLKFGSYCTF